jgi:solute carrier family 25 (mitochondrial phosphate transporter), member 3
MTGGTLACRTTHASVVTLVVAKCRSQAHNSWPKGLISSIRRTWAEEGFRGITKGWVPTLYCYGAQGLFKFGLNEFFKDYYTHFMGAEKIDSTPKKMLWWGVAAG